jgi:hypothetical protein
MAKAQTPSWAGLRHAAGTSEVGVVTGSARQCQALRLTLVFDRDVDVVDPTAYVRSEQDPRVGYLREHMPPK